MEIGVPKEIKDQEFRVGLTPGIVRMLGERGHQVFVETSAGAGSGFTDLEYVEAGANIVPTAAQVWKREMVVKVKEPLGAEYDYLQPEQILFTYLHLAASRTLTEALMRSGVSAIAYETVESPDRKFPLLAPMSAIAGRLSIQFGARFLEKQQGGSGRGDSGNGSSADGRRYGRTGDDYRRKRRSVELFGKFIWFSRHLLI
jgi:alanine dehydrogenase